MFAEIKHLQSMRKRQIAIIPLIVASIIMLLSSIAPHHHHGELICFTISHEQSSQTGKACQHDSNSREKECEVRLLFQTNVIKQHHDECNCCPDLIPDQLFLPMLAFAGLDHSLLLLGTSKEVPPVVYLERLHPITWSLTSAGRAPPVVIA